MRPILTLTVPRQATRLSLKGREQWLDTLAPKETSIHLPDAQACGMPEQGRQLP